MPTYLEAMEEAYHELKEQHAGYRPRIDFYVPRSPITIAGGPWRTPHESWASSPFA